MIERSVAHSNFVIETVGRVRTRRMETLGLEVAHAWLIVRRSLWEKRLDRLGRFLTESEDN